MKRKKRSNRGDILAVNLGDGYFSFAHVLKPPLIAFYDYRSDRVLPVDDIVKLPVAFSVWVMSYALDKDFWPAIGHASVDHIDEAPLFFKQDSMDGSLVVTSDGGSELPATYEQCSRLECAAVWDPNHIVDRLNDHFVGRANRWVESLRAKKM